MSARRFSVGFGLLFTLCGACGVRSDAASVEPGRRLRNAAALPDTSRVRAMGILEPGRAVLVVSDAEGALSVRAVRVPLDSPGTEAGAAVVETSVVLRDDDARIPWVLVNELVGERVLTSEDIDPSALHAAPDGTYWLGERRGPFLLHFAGDGNLLEPPFTLPGMSASTSPFDERNAASSLMRALARHAASHGGEHVPAVSNNHLLTSDGDPATGMGWRAPPATSDLFDPERLQAAGHAVIPWTVNDPARMRALLELGVAGIITDRPDLLYAELGKFDADGDGSPGDLVAADGGVDRTRFDLQGHRGARNLRPENTLPAMEAGLDAHATTLELDVGITSDAVAVVSHDPIVNPSHCRRRDGAAYEDPALIRSLTAAAIQDDFVCDRVSRHRADQTNDRALSPVAVAFAEKAGLSDPYVMPTLAQLFAFTEFYADYHENGAGAQHPEAKTRAADARRVRFNVETKTNPTHPERTVDLETFVNTTAKAIVDAGMVERCNVQSFDFRTNLRLQEKFPDIATAYLFGDSPAAAGYDGANLENADWRAGLAWPYLGVVDATLPDGGGIGGIAASADGRYLHVVVSDPARGADASLRLSFVFDVDRREFLPVRHGLRVPDDAAVSALAVVDATAYAIERADAGGSLAVHILTATDPRRAATRPADAEPSVVDALWAGADGGLWWAGVEDGALVWREYVRR